MFRNLSAKYYQENKEKLEKNLLKNIKIFLNKKNKKKNDITVLNVTKISLKMEKINWRNIEKNIIK